MHPRTPYPFIRWVFACASCLCEDIFFHIIPKLACNRSFAFHFITLGAVKMAWNVASFFFSNGGKSIFPRECADGIFNYFFAVENVVECKWHHRYHRHLSIHTFRFFLVCLFLLERFLMCPKKILWFCGENFIERPINDFYFSNFILFPSQTAAMVERTWLWLRLLKFWPAFVRFATIF